MPRTFGPLVRPDDANPRDLPMTWLALPVAIAPGLNMRFDPNPAGTGASNLYLRTAVA